MYERTGTFLTSPATDLWAVGALAYRLLVGRDWDGSHISPPDDSRYVHNRVLLLEEDGWDERSPSSREFLRRILVPLQYRVTAAQALTLRWLRLFAIPMPGPNSEPPTPPHHCLSRAAGASSHQQGGARGSSSRVRAVRH